MTKLPENPTDGADLDVREVLESTFGAGALDLISSIDDQIPAPDSNESLAADLGSTDEPISPSSDLAADHLVFEHDARLYAIPVGNVSEVQRDMPVTRIPNVPAWIRGVTNLRGTITSVIDLATRLEIDRLETPTGRRMIIVKSSDGRATTALHVDEVLGLRGLRPSLDESASWLSESATAFVTEWRQHGRRRVAVLDLDALILWDGSHQLTA